MTTCVVNLNREPFDVRIDRRTQLGNRYEIGKHGTRAEVIAKHMAEWRDYLARVDMRDAALVALRAMNYVRLIAEFC